MLVSISIFESDYLGNKLFKYETHLIGIKRSTLLNKGDWFTKILYFSTKVIQKVSNKQYKR